MTDTRAAFEKWFRERNKVPDWFQVQVEGAPIMEAMWEAWQAARGEPVAWKVELRLPDGFVKYGYFDNERAAQNALISGATITPLYA
jgi:hypothetical protein